jgi:hypothetical protein
MDQPQYNELVNTFFSCDPQAISEIFQEFLKAMQAEETLPPTCQPVLFTQG